MASISSSSGVSNSFPVLPVEGGIFELKKYVREVIDKLYGYCKINEPRLASLIADYAIDPSPDQNIIVAASLSVSPEPQYCGHMGF